MLLETKWLFIKAELKIKDTRVQSAVLILAVFSQFNESINQI